jgi:hypothetical protein
MPPSSRPKNVPKVPSLVFDLEVGAAQAALSRICFSTCPSCCWLVGNFVLFQYLSELLSWSWRCGQVVAAYPCLTSEGWVQMEGEVPELEDMDAESNGVEGLQALLLSWDSTEQNVRGPSPRLAPACRSGN